MSATMTPAVRGEDGRGPGGMWWVVWRLHRRLVIGWLVGTGLVSALLFWVRRAYDSAEATKSCADVVTSHCLNPVLMAYYDYSSAWLLAFWTFVASPALAGLAGGVALFAVDFDRRTQVFVLSQSVSRLRWFGVGAAVVGAPLVLGSFLLGTALDGLQRLTLNFVIGWNDPFLFSASGSMAAGLCMMGLSIGLLAGVSVRSPLPAALLGVVATVALAGIVLTIRPDLITPTRVVAPISANQYDQIPSDSWTTRGGLLDSRGVEIEYPRCPDVIDQASSERCLADNDVTSTWTEFIPIEQRPQLQQTVAAVYAAVAAVLIAAGALVLRRRRAV